VSERLHHHLQEGFGPQSLGAAYRPVGANNQDNVDFRKQFLDQRNKKNMEEAEDVDVNAAIHGNWTATWPNLL